MASQSEVGHARNVANVRKLIHHIPGTHKKTTESSVVSLLFICKIRILPASHRQYFHFRSVA